MKNGRLSGAAARFSTSLSLLAASLLLLPGGFDRHLGHAAGQAATPVFSDARHAGESHHWEAVASGPPSRCADCLAPGQAPGPPPAGRSQHLRVWTGLTALAGAMDLPDAGAGGAHRPRGPPPSGLS